ncbi:alpha-2B adrenergic receptor-like [Paramacrobiotus metropolitanus]|uniref:alpha-2B adrenergic receptor-like n=1 Tax=Paramacrobiotus metropolitanus TaxID=2943436 RepID=UPI0024456B17|nr:alpha-2B adrenergic receptor-like [Paramacrobiotus metropolitanus]
MSTAAPNASNATSSGGYIPPPPSWSFFPVFNLVTFLLVIFLNSGVLVVFIRDKQLRTPFAMYLMNLLCANIVIAILQNPLDIVTSYANIWYPGQKACTVYLYASYAISGGIMISHVLITTNRIWAICFPFSYKHFHTKKLAMGVCVGMWCYVHILILPGLIMDGLYYRPPLDIMGCSINLGTQKEWSEAVHWLIYNLAEIIVVFAYPVICFYRIRSRKIVKVTTGNSVPANSNPADTNSAEASNISNKPSQFAGEKKKERSYAFMVLTLMTCSVAVFWTPIMVFYGLAPYGYFNYTFYQVARAVYSWECVLDPILFAVAMKDIWKSARRMTGW